MSLEVGSIAPNFSWESTTLHVHLGESWGVLFWTADDLSPRERSELASVAERLAERDVKLLVISSADVGELTECTSFVIDPSKRVSAIISHGPGSDRSFDEIIEVVEARRRTFRLPAAEAPREPLRRFTSDIRNRSYRRSTPQSEQ